jgi:hypothetical protein
MGWPSAPLRRGPDGLEFWLLQYQPNTYHWSIRQFKKIKPAFSGKCITVTVACVEKAAKQKGVRRQISFPTKNRVECTG